MNSLEFVSIDYTYLQ